MVALTDGPFARFDMTAIVMPMNKFQRIQMVRALGLNTEVSVLISSEGDWAANSSFLNRQTNCSVRTFRNIPWSGPEPHLPIIGIEELRARYRELLVQGLNLIVGEPIDPADAELAGCLMVQADHFLAEVAFGPGTVRRVTHDGQIDRVEVIGLATPSADERLTEAAREARNALRKVAHIPLYELQGLVFEFSWYRVPVGSKEQRLIFWEVAGTPAQEDLLGRLIANGPA